MTDTPNSLNPKPIVHGAHGLWSESRHHLTIERTPAQDVVSGTGLDIKCMTSQHLPLKRRISYYAGKTEPDVCESDISK